MKKLNERTKAELTAGAAGGRGGEGGRFVTYWGAAKSIAMAADTIGLFIDGIGDIVETFSPRAEESLADAAGTRLGRTPLRYRYGNSTISTAISTGFF